MLSDPQLHYLDNAATSRVDPAVAQAVSEALTELWANPSSLYDPAVAAQDAIAAARARVAKTLHCRSDEIYFTACGSEGNNMAVIGAARPSTVPRCPAATGAIRSSSRALNTPACSAPSAR